ncbi:hypothetical protein AB6N24_09845 [Cellulomonas sp. 179-A 4D5 NHS]|uniref:hypothetical protein n=1 Tax=Cellulomonas sp. 179-A 4D5 NHS TaxID=3142378 RepID=UPI0039A3E92E
MSDLPAPKRRRVAPAVTDPMAPNTPPHAPAPAAPPAAATPAPQAAPAPAPSPAPSLAPRAPSAPRKQPTVAVFVRVNETASTRFQTLADEAGLTQRAMFEQLVEDAWKRRR